jgi:hypothetical protein
LLTLFFNPVDGAATARTAVLAITRRLLKCMFGKEVRARETSYHSRMREIKLK